MMNSCEVADIFSVYGKDYQKENLLSYKKLKVMNHITVCRTAQLGGHIEKWLNDRKADLLPCNYFHLVFTVPHKLNPIILNNKKIMLNNLFTAVNQTLQAFAKDPQWRVQGQLGFICVLHTWSQKLTDHFHIHCLVAGGA